MEVYGTKREAMINCGYDETIVRVCGGYAVMNNGYYHVWKKQK